MIFHIVVRDVLLLSLGPLFALPVAAGVAITLALITYILIRFAYRIVLVLSTLLFGLVAAHTFRWE